MQQFPHQDCTRSTVCNEQEKRFQRHKEERLELCFLAAAVLALRMLTSQFEASCRQPVTYYTGHTAPPPGSTETLKPLFSDPIQRDAFIAFGIFRHLRPRAVAKETVA